MLGTSKTDVNLVLLDIKRDRPPGAISFNRTRDRALRSAGVFFGFSEHATAVQRIVDDLAHGRSFRINVHSVASFEVSDDTFSGYVQGDSVEFRKTARLNVIDSHKPLIQRQVCIKSHDCLHSSRL